MNEVLDAIKALGQEISNMKAEMVGMKSELQGEISGIKQEMSNMKSELQGEISGIKEEMSDMKSELQEEISGIKQEMSDMKSELQGEISGIKQEMSNMKKELKQEILDTRFILEQEYGEKINSMYDVLVMAKDKEYDNHKEIEKLDNRLTRAEANIFKQGEDIKILTQTR